jgi:uncharacterized protein (TIGR03382 family)
LTEGSDTRGAINSCNTVPAPGALGLVTAGLLWLGRLRRPAPPALLNRSRLDGAPV